MRKHNIGALNVTVDIKKLHDVWVLCILQKRDLPYGPSRNTLAWTCIQPVDCQSYSFSIMPPLTSEIRNVTSANNSVRHSMGDIVAILERVFGLQRCED
mmetsp:Transcript_102806/g.299856  ORF Transcript_102806/g.299856 Transcript_102806/m.299856 type:complete len:99 (+) Transcript_102806:1789-2085(+)